MFTQFNYACKVHQITDRLCLILMGKQKLYVCKNIRGPHTLLRRATC